MRRGESSSARCLLLDDPILRSASLQRIEFPFDLVVVVGKSNRLILCAPVAVRLENLRVADCRGGEFDEVGIGDMTARIEQRDSRVNSQNATTDGQRDRRTSRLSGSAAHEQVLGIGCEHKGAAHIVGSRKSFARCSHFDVVEAKH